MKKKLMFVSTTAVLLFVSANGRARSVVDPRVTTVNAFFKCLKGPTCSTTKVLRGRTSFDEWKRLVRKRQRGGIVVKSTALVANVPARFKDRWKNRWSNAVADLKTAGYSAARLKKLGLGKAIVRASSKVSVAFASVTFEKRGRLKTAYLLLVLWRVKRRWYVAYWEDSPRSFTRFMKTKKPR